MTSTASSTVATPSTSGPPPPDSQEAKNQMFALGTAIAVLGFFLTLIALAFAWVAWDRAGSGAAGADGGASLDADLSEFAVDLSAGSIDDAGAVTIRNTGTMVHNLAVRDTALVSPDLQAGGSATLDLGSLEAGTYELYCAIPGHAEAGMTASLTVGGSGGDATGGGGHSALEMTAAEGAARDAKMIESVNQFPAKTEGLGNQILEPTLGPDGAKQFALTTSVVDWEVRPGEKVKAWAYNGMVPGPRINLAVGDRVEVTIKNDLPIGTDIHWHGIDVPNGQDGVSPITQDLVKRGETYTYRFTVTEPAIGMYHAHAHAHEAVPNGLFGTLYVGDVRMPTGRTVSDIAIPANLRVAQDLPMVLNDAGVIGLSLDGKSFPATTPIVAKVGDWIRLTYFNEGLQVHPMHLHGFEQIVIAKDGEPLDSPYAADTVLVAPGERYTVLFNVNAPGTWVFHCHILNHVEGPDGMFGMVTAVVAS